MKREEKEHIMDCVANDIDKAKYNIDRAAEYLEEKGLVKDAEQLMKIIYKLESIENKYNKYRL